MLEMRLKEFERRGKAGNRAVAAGVGGYTV